MKTESELLNDPLNLNLSLNLNLNLSLNLSIETAVWIPSAHSLLSGLLKSLLHL